VPDGLVARITPGVSLNITSESLGPDTFEGTVTSVSPSADGQAHIFNVEVTIPNKTGLLKPGMIGAIEIHPAAASGIAPVPGVPLTSIVRSSTGDGTYAVFVVERHGEQDIARARAVTLGTVQGNMMTVTHGLAAGERVIMMGASLVHDQEPVRVIR
jgi:RND family efflux transporter MFP subunit